MNVGEIKNLVMFQYGNDAEDVEEYMPALLGYIQDGYDRLVMAWSGVHPSADGVEWPQIELDTDVPMTPEWTHKAIADWATWCVYRNGNPQKQQRGYAFRQAFDEALARIREHGGGTPVRNFTNIPW